MAQNTDPERLGLELASKHTKSWHRQDMLLGSSMGRNQVKVLVELEILRKHETHLVEEEREVSKSFISILVRSVVA